MGLQWVIITYVVAAEATVALLLTLPTPKAVTVRLLAFVSPLLTPATAILPFAAFQLLDIYWKQEHRPVCSTDTCTSVERIRFEKFTFKSERNTVLCASAILLYWCISRICKYKKDILAMEEVERRHKDL